MALHRALSGPVKAPSLNASSFSLRETFTLPSSDIPAFYVFDNSSDYTIIVGSDTRVASILGVIPGQIFNKQTLPSHISWWLDSYAQEITTVLSQNEDSDSDDYLSDIYSVIDHNRLQINPLLSTSWDQDYPYNSLCPNSGLGQAVTGCVATAMAQVMAYYQWPKQGRGFSEYNSGSFDYENTIFSWDEMLDTYYDDEESTFAQRIAVAELMYACGVGVRMLYTPQISGAYTMRIADAMRDHFRYSSSTCYKVRDVYSRLEWEDMIYRELEAGRPVLYGGRGELGGHSFVCDGYLSDGLFHFNWGWSGNYDGYFRISALNPMDVGIGGGSGQFNSDQDAIMGIVPDYEDEGGVEPSPLFSTSGFTPGSNFYNRGDRFDLQFTIDRGAIINPSAKSYKGTLGVLLFDGRSQPEWIPGSEVEFEPIDDDGNMPPKTRYSGSITYKGRSAGEYRIFPAFCREGGEPERIRVCDATSQYLLMTMNENGKASLRQDFSGIIPDIIIPELSSPDELQSRSPLAAEFTLVNGMSGYKGNLYLTANPEAGGAECIIGVAEVDETESHILLSSVTLEETLNPGRYFLRIRDDMWRSLAPEIAYEIQQAGIESISPTGKNNLGEEKALYYTLDGCQVSGPENQQKVLVRVSADGEAKLFITK